MLARRRGRSRATRASRPPSSRRSGSRTSARRPSCGSGATRAAGRTRDRLAGPAHGRSAARELPAELIRERTGLVPDPYFSATKLEWLLARTGLPRSELAFGTVDTWLVWKLTGGRVHVTDLTNASRTMLLDLGHARLGRRAARPVRRRPGAAARDRAARREVVGEAELLGVTLPIAGHRRRPAGGALRPRLLRPRPGEGDVRHRQLRARERRQPSAAPAPAAASSRRVAASGGYALEGAILVERRGDPVAAGRARAHRRRGESEALARARRLDGRRLLRAGVRRPRLAALERRGARRDQRDHARHDPRAARARRARGDRVPGADVLDLLPGASRCCVPRRRERERLPDAVPGRSARLPGRGRGASRRRPRSAPPRSPAGPSATGRTTSDPGRSGRVRSTSLRPTGRALRPGARNGAQRSSARSVNQKAPTSLDSSSTRSPS